MLTCAHCNSQSIVYDREYVAGTGWAERPRCMKCGREKFKEVEAIQPVKPANNITQNYSSPMQVGEKIAKKQAKSVMLEPQKEGKVMPEKPRCKKAGCGKIAAIRGCCNNHFFDAYGITAGEYRRNKIKHLEDPREVAERMKAGDGKKRAKTETKAPEPETKQGFDEPIQGDESIRVILYPEVIKKLAEMARAEFRSVEMQAAYLLSKELGA